MSKSCGKRKVSSLTSVTGLVASFLHLWWTDGLRVLFLGLVGRIEELLPLQG